MARQTQILLANAKACADLTVMSAAATALASLITAYMTRYRISGRKPRPAGLARAFQPTGVGGPPRPQGACLPIVEEGGCGILERWTTQGAFTPHATVRATDRSPPVKPKMWGTFSGLVSLATVGTSPQASVARE